MIGGLKYSAGRGYERLAPFLMGGGEEGFKYGPGLELRGLVITYFTFVKKQPCLENELESNDYNLLRKVGPVDSCRVFDSSFYLIDECFDGVVGVVGGA